MNIGSTSRLQLESDKIKSDDDRVRLETDVAGVEGVRDVDVDTNAHTVTIEYDPSIVDESRLRAQVEEAGYKLSSGSDRYEAEQFVTDEVEADNG